MIRSAKSIVVKIGTHVLTRHDGRLDVRRLNHLGRQLADLANAGRRVVVVSSGAIGAGVGQLSLPGPPRSIPEKQAAAAVGQGQLMRHFDRILSRCGLHVGQMLLTRRDFEYRHRYLNIHNTIQALHRLGAIPIINENDTVAVDEIRFGDNDILAALVANMLRAELLVLLTNVDGVVRRGETLDLIERFDATVREAITPAVSALGSGGMATKLEAAGLVTEAGEVAVIANGTTRNILPRLLAGEKLGTVLLPARRKLPARKRWIGMTAKAVGKVVIDEGAARALRHGGKSLLAIGITDVRGRFEPGDAVRVLSPDGSEIARGLVNYSAAQLRLIAGKCSDRFAAILGDHPYDEVIHRDNLTLRTAQR